MQSPHDDHIEQLAAWSRVNLDMQAAEFFALEPCDFFRLLDMWNARDRRERIRFAQVCLAIASSSGSKPANGEPLTLGFFLGEKPPAPPGRVKRVSLKQQFIDALPAHFRPHGHS